MFMGVFQLLQAKQEEVAVKRRHIERLRDYWTARAELEQILGGRLVGRTAVAFGRAAVGMDMGMSMGAGGH